MSIVDPRGRLVPTGTSNFVAYTQYDLTCDSKINLQDYGLFASEWLTDNLLQSIQPSAYWKFDEGTGTTADDSSGFNSTAQLISTQWGSGVFQGALDFDGTSGYAIVTDNDKISVGGGDFTISAWIYPRVLNRGGIAVQIKGNYKEYALSLFGPKLALEIENNGNNGIARTIADIVRPNTWQHVAVTFNSSDKHPSFYYNGSMILTEKHNITEICTQLDGDLYIGIQNQRFDGKIDDLRIYSQKLSPQEIQVIYQSRPLTGYNACSGYMPFDLNADCITGLDDLIMITDGWLLDKSWFDGNLLGFWKLDETSGDALDSSLYQDNMVLTGTGITQGVSGFDAGSSAYSFAGSGYLSAASNESFAFTGTDSFTLQCWFKTSSAGTVVMVSKPNTYCLYTIDGVLSAWIMDESLEYRQAIGSTPVADGQWHHAAVVCDRSTQLLTLYVDGHLDGSAVDISPIVNMGYNSTLCIGGLGPYLCYIGTIDEVSIHKRVLTSVDFSYPGQ